MTLALLFALLPPLQEAGRATPGIERFQVETRLVYEGHADAPHLLTTVYQTPDRVRWLRRLEGAAPHVRDLEYRSEGRFFVLPRGTATSRELEGRAAEELLVRFELRRALLGWPGGFSWRPGRGEGTTRVTEIPSPLGGDATPLARVHATLDERGRPGELRVEWPPNTTGAAERLIVDEWREMEGRAWPAVLRLQLGESPVWREELLTISTRIDYLDLFFLPPDRRGRAGEGRRSLDLVPVTRRGVPLAEGTSWEQALARHASLLQEGGPGTPPIPLDPVPTFELAPDGLPRTVVLRLAALEEPAPPGWETLRERPGLALPERPLPDLDADDLAEIRRGVSGERFAPYARLRPGPDAWLVQVFLPLGPGKPAEGR